MTGYLASVPRNRRSEPRREGPPPGPSRLSQPPAVAWRDGVQLAGSIVWCDAGRARDLCFVSHAHHLPRGAHRKLIASPRTLALLEAGGATLADEVLPVPFGRAFHLGELRLELYPSGHVPGAASLLLTDGAGRRIAYGGDVNPVRALGEPAEVRACDALVLEAPLGELERPLPPRDEVRAHLVELVRRLVAEQPVVVLAPSLGAAQEALSVLARAGLALRAHPRIYAQTAACARLGMELPAAARFTRRLDAGEVLLWPLELAHSRGLTKLCVQQRAARVALSGLALDERAARTLGAEHVLPLSDHGDLPSLVDYVLASGARELYLTRGHGPRLVERFATHGVRVHPLAPPRQMELPV